MLTAAATAAPLLILHICILDKGSQYDVRPYFYKLTTSSLFSWPALFLVAQPGLQ